MYPLIETIRVFDGIPQNLSWHQERLERSTMSHFGKNTSLDIREFIQVPPEFRTGIVRCRIDYNVESYKILFTRHIPRIVKSLKLVNNDQIDYSLKYSDRETLNKLLEFKGECDDIIIVKNGLLTDTSFSNIVFLDGAQHYTPHKPLLEGTKRRKLLAEGRIIEVPIGIEEIDQFKSVKLINALLDLEDTPEISTSMIQK